MVEKRFRVLRWVASLCRIIAWITLIGGVLGMLGSIVTGAVGANLLREYAGRGVGGIVGGITVGLTILVMAALQSLFLYVITEGIHLLLSIEENTRQAAYILSQERQS